MRTQTKHLTNIMVTLDALINGLKTGIETFKLTSVNVLFQYHMKYPVF